MAVCRAFSFAVVIFFFCSASCLFCVWKIPDAVLSLLLASSFTLFARFHAGCGFFFFQWGQYGFEVFIRVYVSDVLATQGAGVCLFGYEPFAQGNKVFLQTCPHGMKQVIRFFVFLFGGAQSFFRFPGFFAQGGQVLFLFVDVFFQSGCFGCSGFDGLQGLLQLPYRYIGLVGLFQLLVDRGGIHGFTLLA